jgi:uncharacterized protein (TIGR03435 family)
MTPQRWIVMLLVVVTAATLSAQSTAAFAVESMAQARETLQFEVASVKESKSAEPRASRRFLPGGRVEISDFPLRMLIGLAYGIDTVAQPFRLTGGPGKLLERRFDISAKASADLASAPADLVIMIRALLADRFGFKSHVESRSMTIYALSVTELGKLGPKLRPSEHNCRELTGTGMYLLPRDENGKALCAQPGMLEILPGGVRRRHAGTMATLAQLIQLVTPELQDRPVIDMTGLTGNFQWEVTYSQGQTGREPDDNLPSVFTAFREQLGLKLEPKTAPVEVLVIDSLSLPSLN